MNISKHSTDPDLGEKGKNEFWLGYKLNVVVNMETGLILNHEIT